MSRTLLVAVAALVLATADVAWADVDDEIAFYQDRMARDPGDFLTPVQLADAYLRKARTTGDPSLAAQAVAASARALMLMPNHVPALILRAAAKSAEHRFPEALAAARRASELDPANPGAAAALGDALLNLGAAAEARKAYDVLHVRAPGFGSFARLARWRRATGDDAGALADWGRAIAGNETDTAPAEIAWAHLQRGALHFARGHFAATETDYLDAQRLDPGASATAEHLAELHAAQGRNDQAQALYEHVAARVERPDLQQTIGDFFVFTGRPAEARAWHDRAEAGYHRSAERGEVLYYHHLASFYADVRPKPMEAVIWARKDLALRQTSGAYDGLAWALHKSGEAAAARAAIDRALAANVEDPHLLRHAALIYAAAGASAEGAPLLRKAYALNAQLDRFHAHR